MVVSLPRRCLLLLLPLLLLLLHLTIAFAGPVRGPAAWSRVYQRHSSPGIGESFPKGDYWSGFQNVKYLMVFGDSYSTVRFDINGSPKPTVQNPLGVQYPGIGSPNGPCWTAYLTHHYNQSTLFTFDVAFGGATVDRSVITPFVDYIWTFRDQVSKWNARLGITSKNLKLPYTWSNQDTLFIIWFGINDIWRSNGLANASSMNMLYDRVMDSYFQGVQELYNTGARNFVFINVPPLELTPELRVRSVEAQETIRSNVNLYNSKLLERIRDLKTRLPSITVFHIDVHSLIHAMTINAPFYGLRDVSTRCVGYVPFDYPDLAYDARTGKHKWEAKFDERCGLDVSRYLWLDGLHPTSKVHEVLAGTIAQSLMDLQ